MTTTTTVAACVWWLVSAGGWPNAVPSTRRRAAPCRASLPTAAAASAVVYASGRVPRAWLDSKRHPSVAAAPDRKIRTWRRNERAPPRPLAPALNYNGLGRRRRRDERSDGGGSTYPSDRAFHHKTTFVISRRRKWRLDWLLCSDLISFYSPAAASGASASEIVRRSSQWAPDVCYMSLPSKLVTDETDMQIAGWRRFSRPKLALSENNRHYILHAFSQLNAWNKYAVPLVANAIFHPRNYAHELWFLDLVTRDPLTSKTYFGWLHIYQILGSFATSQHVSCVKRAAWPHGLNLWLITVQVLDQCERYFTIR